MLGLGIWPVSGIHVTAMKVVHLLLVTPPTLTKGLQTMMFLYKSVLLYYEGSVLLRALVYTAKILLSA